MQLARVKGTVVSTNKAEKLYGLKLLIVKPIDIETWQEKGGLLVAIDAVGAGEGEVVMLVGGSSSRQTNVTENKPVDQSIVAIIYPRQNVTRQKMNLNLITTFRSCGTKETILKSLKCFILGTAYNMSAKS